ncbi:hypothetical protein FQZ97_1265190 [compost metagenome]
MVPDTKRKPPLRSSSKTPLLMVRLMLPGTTAWPRKLRDCPPVTAAKVSVTVRAGPLAMIRRRW